MLTTRRHWIRWLACTALTVRVTLLSFAAAPAMIDDGFTVAVLPDTQLYSLNFPDTYYAQTRWIAANAARYNIAYVLHVGDVTDKNTAPEWQVAAKAHAEFNGVLPCAIVPGNHDLRTGRDAGLTGHFSVADARRMPTFGDVYDKEPASLNNSYHTFSAGGRKWLILALEFGPRDDVLRWANEVVATHPDQSVILLTHAYLRPDATRYDRNIKVVVKGQETDKGLSTKLPFAKDPAGYNDGEEMWKKLVSLHSNFAFVICGHTCVTAHRTDLGRAGNPVHQILVDYQNQPNGGNGYLRLLQFSANGKTVQVTDYSPTLDQISEIKGSHFTLDVPPPPRAKR